MGSSFSINLPSIRNHHVKFMLGTLNLLLHIFTQDSSEFMAEAVLSWFRAYSGLQQFIVLCDIGFLKSSESWQNVCLFLGSAAKRSL